MTVCGEKVTGVCVAAKCPYFKLCHPVVWDKYGKPQTNEEWRKTCSAKEFAKWLEEICFREQYNDGESMSGWYEKHDEKYWEKWLKEKHNESV